MNALKNLTRRAAAAALALVMCLGLLNITAFAADITKCPNCGGDVYEKGNFRGCETQCGWQGADVSVEPEDTKPDPSTCNHEYNSDGTCTICGVNKYGVDPGTPVEPSRPGGSTGGSHPPIGPFHNSEDCRASVRTWLHDDDANEHYAHCSIVETNCPLWEQDYEIREGCSYVKNSAGIEECTVCHYQKSPVELNPGGENRPECPDGKHTWSTFAQPINPAYHMLTCLDCLKCETVACEPEFLYRPDGQPVAYYCPVCHNCTSIVDPDKDQYCTDLQGGHQWGKEKEELSPNGQDVLTTLECSKCGAKKITNVCSSPAKVTVHYVYADGTQAAPDATQAVFNGSSYELKSPDIAGFTSDMAVIAGTSGGKGEEFTVTYTKKADTYTLTIEYCIDGQDEPFKIYSKAGLADGESYDVTSPDKTGEGYELAAGAQDEVKSGKINKANAYYRVDYKPIHYTWTIYHFYRNDAGENIEVKKPDVFGFTVEDTSKLVDRAVAAVDGYTTETISVKAPALKPLGDKEDVVYYEPIPGTYTLTVRFVDSEGTELAEPRAIVNLHPGDKRTPEAADIRGWSTNTQASEITMGEKDETFTFEYTRNKYRVIVSYVYANGSAAAPTQEQEVEFGRGYDVVSPTIRGYSADMARVSGTMDVPENGESLSFTVIYTAPTPGTPVTPPEENDTPVTPPEEDNTQTPPAEDNDPAPPLEDVEDPDVPLTDLPEEDAPLASIPEEEPPVGDEPLEDIDDGDVPLAAVPETGDLSFGWYLMTALSALGLAVLGRKRRQED